MSPTAAKLRIAGLTCNLRIICSACAWLFIVANTLALIIYLSIESRSARTALQTTTKVGTLASSCLLFLLEATHGILKQNEGEVLLHVQQKQKGVDETTRTGHNMALIAARGGQRQGLGLGLGSGGKTRRASAQDVILDGDTDGFSALTGLSEGAASETLSQMRYNYVRSLLAKTTYEDAAVQGSGTGRSGRGRSGSGGESGSGSGNGPLVGRRNVLVRAQESEWVTISMLVVAVLSILSNIDVGKSYVCVCVCVCECECV